MDVGPCAVSAIQIKPRSVRLIINRPAVSGYNVTSVGAKSGHTQILSPPFFFGMETARTGGGK